MDQMASPQSSSAPSRWTKDLSLVVGLASIGGLLGLVLFGRPDLTYDEPDYLSTVNLLDRLGLSRQFIQEYPVAAGPLFSMVHWLARAATGLQAPGVRLYQVALLLSSLTLLATAARHFGFLRPWHTALSLIAVPMVFTVSGMALTEIPAVLLCSAGIALLGTASGGGDRTASLAAAAGAGLAFGLASIGRQPIVIVFGLSPLLLVGGRWRWPQVLTFVAVGGVLPATVFLIWGGFVPPRLAHFDGFSLRHGVLALAYGCVALFLLRPHVLRVGRGPLLALFAASLVGNAFIGVADFVPLRSILTRHAPGIIPAIGGLTGGGALFAALLFVTAVGRQLWRARLDGPRLFLGAAALSLVAANVKVSYFSTRYIVPATPFLLFVGGEEDPSIWRGLRLAAGAAVGAMSLMSYLYP